MTRDVLFISKATPGDDEFALWLAPRLEAAGYTVFADILSLEPGDRWRKQVTGTLQDKAVKMLLCCRDASLSKDGVQEEIGIALDLVKELGDQRFIIPLRLERFKKLFGIGELQYIDFVGSWANGLRALLDALDRQNIPRQTEYIAINPSWDSYKKRLAIRVNDSPEVLTSNWLRIAAVPDVIRYYQPPGAIDHGLMEMTCSGGSVSAKVYLRGFFSFAAPDEIDDVFENVGKFVLHSEYELLDFLETGSDTPNIRPREAKNFVSSMFREAWEKYCRSKSLYQYAFSKQLGFHVTESLVPLGKRIPWGAKERRRSAALCNSAKGRVWQYGVSATPAFWPLPHFKLKPRVLFASLAGQKTGAIIDDPDQQHRLRRGICSVWRNKAWHGRMMAFLEILSGSSTSIDLPLSKTTALTLDATPLRVTSPVTTALPDVMSDDGEEQDTSTLGNFGIEDDD